MVSKVSSAVKQTALFFILPHVFLNIHESFIFCAWRWQLHSSQTGYTWWQPRWTCQGMQCSCKYEYTHMQNLHPYMYYLVSVDLLCIVSLKLTNISLFYEYWIDQMFLPCYFCSIVHFFPLYSSIVHSTLASKHTLLFPCVIWCMMVHGTKKLDTMCKHAQI